MKLTKHKKYQVRWQDIEGLAQWMSEAEILKRQPVIVESVYYYVGKSKAGYCFAADISEEKEEDTIYASIAIIPLAVIKAIKPIK